MAGGFGNVAYGQCEHGHAKSDLEPRFEGSSPADAATGISVYDVVIKYTIYGFSSRVQVDDSLVIEVSEDAGATYSDAYRDGAFVAPYNGANSEIDDHESEPHALLVRIHKTSTWAYNEEIRVMTTSVDEYGQAATKSTLITWGEA